MPLPRVERGSYSPDGTRLAYQPNFQWQAGVEALSRRADHAHLDRRPGRLRRRKVPRRTTRTTPTRCGSATRSTSSPTATAPITLSRLRPADEEGDAGRENERASTSNSASAGAGAIVYEQFGSLHLFDPATRKATRCSMSDRRPTSRSYARTSTRSTRARIANAAISPTGSAPSSRRAARSHGAGRERRLRNLTHIAGRRRTRSRLVARRQMRSPSSPTHRASTRCTSRDQSGMGEAKNIALGDPASFFYHPVWSPD